jgi:hypothetical protein
VNKYRIHKKGLTTARIGKKWKDMLRETSHNQERSIRRKKGGKAKEKGEVKSNRKGTRKEEVEVVNWKRHEKVTLEKRDNGRRRKPTWTKICRKTRIILKNKTKVTNLWTIIQMEEKRRLELFRKAKQIIELLERETKTEYNTSTNLPSNVTHDLYQKTEN